MEHALALAPELPEAHSTLGEIQMSHDWDWPGAEASLHRALELAPGNAVVLGRAGTLAFCLGRLDEAIELEGHALEQDPLSARSYFRLGDTLDVAGRLTEAEAAVRKALELAPQIAATRAMLALNLLAQGRSEEALAEALREPDEAFRLRATPIIHHVAGRRAESDAALQELIGKYATDSAYQVAEVYAARGEVDLAFEWLDRAYVQHDPGLSRMKVERTLCPLHTDPRWGAFLRKMRLVD